MAINGRNTRRQRCYDGKLCPWCFPGMGKRGGNRPTRFTIRDRRIIESMRSQLKEIQRAPRSEG